MAIAAWKRLEKSPGYQRKKLLLKRLIGKEPRIRPEVDLKAIKRGGWWFCPDGLDAGSIVYSLGIGEDVEFDLSLIAEHGLHVHAFDPTPSTVEWLRERPQPPNFHFHPWAVTAVDGSLTLYPRIRHGGSKSTVMYTMIADDETRGDGIDVSAFSLPSIVARLGHERIDLLKVDIEGAEYEVLDSLLRATIRPVQLLVEFHHRFPGIGPQKTVDMITRLREAGYRVFSISETGREISFIRRP